MAEAVRLARVQVVAAYPITPQTPIYEKLSDMELEGKLTGVMMRTNAVCTRFNKSLDIFVRIVDHQMNVQK